MALSIVRWIRIGIVSESAGERERAREPDRGEAPLLPPERQQVPERGDRGEIGRIDLAHRLVSIRGVTD